ncbi:MAG: hypothetical protein ACI8Z5_000155 [Lentimonas sp.]|jgi:hypothetical protein
MQACSGLWGLALEIIYRKGSAELCLEPVLLRACC